MSAVTQALVVSPASLVGRARQDLAAETVSSLVLPLNIISLQESQTLALQVTEKLISTVLT